MNLTYELNGAHLPRTLAPALTRINGWRMGREKGEPMNYTCIEQEQAHMATRQLLDLLGGEAYDAWYERTFGPLGHKGDFCVLRDAALAEFDRLTECTCMPDSVNACPACLFAIEHSMEVDEFPY